MRDKVKQNILTIAIFSCYTTGPLLSVVGLLEMYSGDKLGKKISKLELFPETLSSITLRLDDQTGLEKALIGTNMMLLGYIANKRRNSYKP